MVKYQFWECRKKKLGRTDAKVEPERITVKWETYIHANNSCLYPNERSRLVHAQGLKIAFLTFKSSFDTNFIYSRDLPIKQNGRFIGLRYNSSELA